MAPLVDASLTCPLCGGRGTPIEHIPYDEIWESYTSELGVTFSRSVMTRHTPAEAATLRACDVCELQFFTPKVPGDEDFYNELMSSVSYLPQRWQFEVVRRRLKDVSSVIDVGCGSGAFLRQIEVARAVGIDRNPDVHACLSEHGIEVHDDLAELAVAEPGAFDVICAFEVLEHVENISAILEPVRTVLRPGGRLFVSVPNRKRPRPLHRQALDLPPHHVSRWHASHARVLADRFGLRLVRVDCEPRLWGTIVSRVPRVARALAAAPGQTCLRAGGSLLRPGSVGHSLLFEFRSRRPLNERAG